MRNRIALALALCAAAAPLHAQRADSVYHGPGYDLVLPARYRYITSHDRVEEGERIRAYVFGSSGGALVVVRLEPGTQLTDTSLVTRRAVLQIMHAATVQKAGDMRLTGEPVEIVRDDRVTLRAPVVMARDGVTVRGTVDLSVARRGPVVVWMVTAVREHPGPRDEETARRTLDSFALTGAGDPALDDGVIVEAGTKRVDDLDAKP